MHFAYFGFLCSLNHLSGPLRKYIFTCMSSKGHGLSFVIGGSRSVLFLSCYNGLLLRVEEHRTRHQNGMGKRETLSLIYDKCKQPGSRKRDKRMH